uniref:Uncharacterized protein n=1 Tax=Anguilla anguilla TaxID=7936 RepID=A0A0E9R6G1_ANGAN
MLTCTYSSPGPVVPLYLLVFFLSQVNHLCLSLWLRMAKPHPA